jgi:hypothetical protein
VFVWGVWGVGCGCGVWGVGVGVGAGVGVGVGVGGCVALSLLFVFFALPWQAHVTKNPNPVCDSRKKVPSLLSLSLSASVPPQLQHTPQFKRKYTRGTVGDLLIFSLLRARFSRRRHALLVVLLPGGRAPLCECARHPPRG